MWVNAKSEPERTMKLKSLIYRLLSISNDVNAVRKGKICKRLVRKAGWRKFASIMRRI
jgi:hypothetical protein